MEKNDIETKAPIIACHKFYKIEKFIIIYYSMLTDLKDNEI